jgi:hypothetical protein
MAPCEISLAAQYVQEKTDVDRDGCGVKSPKEDFERGGVEKACLTVDPESTPGPFSIAARVGQFQ